MTAELIQGTPEWKAARCGSLGASQIAEALAKARSGPGWGVGRANVMAALIAERLTGQPSETYVSGPMQWGTDTEAQAREAYCFKTDAEIETVGLVRHPAITGAHASPDGLVNADGLVEIKCPNTATHLDTLLGASVPGKYVMQAQWQMACTGRLWCDLVSFDPRLPAEMQLWLRRIERDDGEIARLEAEVRTFLAELDAKLGRLRNQFGLREAA